LILYRRHNAARCNAVETNAPCTNKRKGCPIWVRGEAPDGHYVEKSLKSLTGKIARDWEDARQTLRDWEATGSTPAPTAARTTIATWKAEYTALATANKLSSETLRKYKHLFAQLEAYATAKGLRFVDEFDLQVTTDFRLSWADGALSTAKKLERLRSIMKLAVEREWLSKNFAAMLKAPKVKQSPTLPFTTDEMKKIVKAARDNQRVYTFILVMRSSGLRISDVTKLAVDSLKGNRLSLHQAKTGEHVSILLDHSVADALRAVVPLNRNKSYFFWTGESKVPAAVSNWRKRIADVFTAAGIVNGHTHRFRDTFAVALLEKGATIENVSRLLGHTSIKITERHYSPWVQSRQDALDAALVGANGWLAEVESALKDNVRQISRKK
jgi:integrase/recombinase XerD